MDVRWFPTISYVKIGNHPIETTIYKLLFGVPGRTQLFFSKGASSGCVLVLGGVEIILCSIISAQKNPSTNNQSTLISYALNHFISGKSTILVQNKKRFSWQAGNFSLHKRFASPLVSGGFPPTPLSSIFAVAPIAPELLEPEIFTPAADTSNQKNEHPKNLSFKLFIKKVAKGYILKQGPACAIISILLRGGHQYFLVFAGGKSKFARWFNSWPFHPLVGGHDFNHFKKVTFSQVTIAEMPGWECFF